jgi:hypothetical protein
MVRKQRPWYLPVTTYAFDAKSHRYVLTSCLLYQVPMRTLPATLDCTGVQSVLRDNVELLKSALRAPAIVLLRDRHMTAYGASGDEWPLLPPMHEAKHRLIHAYEMKCVNLTTHIINYRLRNDGSLVLSGATEFNCDTCQVPESLSLASLGNYLRRRAHCIKKTLRDRRLIVEMGSHRSTVYSVDTMRRRNVIEEENE